VATHPLLDAETHARRWLAGYPARPDDVLGTDPDPAWAAMFTELASGTADLGTARERVGRHAADVGAGFGPIGDGGERPWPLSPVPLLIHADEWAGIAAGIAQRADLLEAITADLYGEARLVAEGHLPAAVVTGSPGFLRPMIGLEPPGGRHLRFCAFDLGRDPAGGWRVLSDHLRAPAGAGYALENRLAVGRALGGLKTRLNIRRHAPFFAAFRAGLSAICRRAEPRIGLLTPGRHNPTYPEQAHLARYLGLLLVEGADLAALEGQLYLRTVGGLKRIDALWNRMAPRLLDPLAFDTRSQIGVPGLIEAHAAGLAMVNAPGAGLLEAPAFAAFFPALAERLGTPLQLPGIATWWLGGDAARAEAESGLDRLLVGPAFGPVPLGLAGSAPVPGRTLGEAFRADLARRPHDYVAQEDVRLSTMPVVVGDRLEPRPFTLRVFAARDAEGDWIVLPGGFARIGETADSRAAAIGEGLWSADVCIHGPDRQVPVTLLPDAGAVRIRRNPGTLPSRAADNLFWLGRYLDRGEALLAPIRALLGGGALGPATLGRLVGLIAGTGAAPSPAGLAHADLSALARTAMDDTGWHSVAAIDRLARDIADGARDRLSADLIRLLEAPPPDGEPLDRIAALGRRYAAIAGLAAEHMVRTAAWRFHDLGRRIERGVAAARAARLFGTGEASRDDLATLLDLADSQISYRQRYPTGLSQVAVLDLVALDPGNPRSLAFQTARIVEHLCALPVLADDGMAEPQQARARALDALVANADAATLDADTLGEVERRLAELSEAIARRYFLQGAEPLRAEGLTLA